MSALAAAPGRGSPTSSCRPRSPTRTPPAPRRDPRLTPAWRAPFPLIPIGERDGHRADFGVGIPDWESFPFGVWRRLSGRALRAVSQSHVDYGEPEGRPALREAIAGHVSFARAIACTSGDIVVTAGAQQAFDLLARILVTPGKTIAAVEDPGYPPLRNVLAVAGATVAPVPVDGEGIRVDLIPRNAKVICVTPSHQFPLGVHLSLPRRKALLNFAQVHRAVVIEDDYDGEFRFAGKPLDALKTLDHSQSVFYVGTFSKSLFPSLRLGFVIAPEWALHALVTAKQVSDWNAPLVAQDVLTAFIAEGHLVRHVRKMRRIYSERRDILQSAIERFCSRNLEVIGIGAGMHLAALLKGSISATRLIDRAQTAGVRLHALQRFAVADYKAEGFCVRRRCYRIAANWRCRAPAKLPRPVIRWRCFEPRAVTERKAMNWASRGCGPVARRCRRRRPIARRCASIALSPHRPIDSRTLLMPEKITDASERETQFGIRPRPNLSGDDGRCRKRGTRGIGNPRKMFRLGSAAEQDAEAHPVGYRAQQRLAGIQAVARVVETGLAGVQQAEVAQELTFRAPIPQFARDDERRVEVIPGLVEPGQAVVDHSEVAQHDALQAGMPQVARHRQRRIELIERLGEPSLHLVQQTQVAQRMLPSSRRFPISRAAASAASSCDRAFVHASRV